MKIPADLDPNPPPLEEFRPRTPPPPEKFLDPPLTSYIKCLRMNIRSTYPVVHHLTF